MNVKGVKRFLGLTGYYHKCISNYVKIAKPLTELSKKDKFLWNAEAAAAFEILKKAVTKSPILALPNFSIPFQIDCDVSESGGSFDAVYYSLL